MRVHLILLPLLVVLIAPGAYAQLTPNPPVSRVAAPGHRLQVIIANHAPGKDLFVALFASEADFQSSRQCRAGRWRSAAVNGDTIRVTLDSLPEGDYVLASFQDMDGDGKMSRGMFGMPTDPYRIFLPNYNIFGPRFDKCKFHLPGPLSTATLNYARNADKASRDR